LSTFSDIVRTLTVVSYQPGKIR